MVESDSPNADSFAHAAEQLRELDPDRYAASLIIPPEHRAGVQALYAFAAEVAAIRERVSEPAPGEIRLQWWVDALEGEGHGAVAHNPIANALLTTLKKYDLPKVPLLRLLAARRFDLYGDAMPDRGQFEGYAGETVSILYQYAAMILAGGPAEQAADAAGHLGVAQALAGHLRAFGFNASRSQLFLPLSVFTAHGVRESEIYAGQGSAGLNAALDQLCELGQDHAQKARSALVQVPRSMRAAFAPLVLVEADLRVLARGRENVFTSPARQSPFRRLSAIVWWGIRNG